MILSLTTSYLKDLLFLLKKQKDFFSLPPEKKRELAEHQLGSKALADYLVNVSEAELVEDLRIAFKKLKGSLEKEQKSRIVQAVSDYFVREFPVPFDQLDKSFYGLSSSDQLQHLEKLFSQKNDFFGSLVEMASVKSPQEIGEEIVQFLRDEYASPRIVIQSPSECDLATKAEIRTHFQQEYPLSFVTFHINSQLIGGIRFFV